MPDDGVYDFLCPFWIDTAAYSDRDRAMFTAGFEFALVVHLLEHDGDGWARAIHPENASRVRMAAGRFGRRVSVEPYDTFREWLLLDVAPRKEPPGA